MKLLVVTFVIFAVVMTCSSAPVESEKTQLDDVDSGSMINPHVEVTRNRRFSCDLFSFESELVTPKDTVCAGKCIGMNRRGGHCENNLCVCREEKIIESLP